MSRRGFTLVEVMIGSTLVALVAIGILTVIISFAKNTSRYAARQDLIDLGKLMQLILINDGLCDRALRDVVNNPVDFVPPQANVGTVFNPTDGAKLQPIVKSNDIYKRLRIGQITIVKSDGAEPPRTEELTLTDQLNPAAPPVTNTYTIYRANLVIPATTHNDDPTGPRDRFAPLTIPLRIYIQGTRLARCHLATATNQTCSSLGGTYDATRGRCVFPTCDQALIDQQTPRLGLDYSCQHGTNCSPDIYFWGFQALGGTNTLPVCICTNSCASEPPY